MNKDNTEEENLDTANENIHNDDVQFEDIEEGENPALLIKKLREKLRTCENEKKEYLDGWQRMRADYANARKEEESRRGDMTKFASEGLEWRLETKKHGKK
jgi:molecular chaperone GrpE (heat shock protein)